MAAALRKYRTQALQMAQQSGMSSKEKNQKYQLLEQQLEDTLRKKRKRRYYATLLHFREDTVDLFPV